MGLLVAKRHDCRPDPSAQLAFRVDVVSKSTTASMRLDWQAKWDQMVCGLSPARKRGSTLQNASATPQSLPTLKT